MLGFGIFLIGLLGWLAGGSVLIFIRGLFGKGRGEMDFAGGLILIGGYFRI